MKEDLPYPRNYRRTLPTILSPEEAVRLIDSARNLFHRAILMTLYCCGLRRIELCRLKVSDIDSQRMVLRVEQGKGGVDRDVPISPKLVATLRDYWRWMRPNTYLFPGTVNGWRADKPISPKVVWEAVRYASKKVGIDKPVSPHMLRHYADSPTGGRSRVENAAGPARPSGSRHHIPLSALVKEAPTGSEYTA